eukprot:Anaeramoba_ignava/a349603_33.p1 GENE.a349603_33~~a349603_33.p1  ORF type:complete len:211 (+),score=79.75 a349603_33:33-635(+)
MTQTPNVDDFSITHPLHSPWVFWAMVQKKQTAQNDWQSQLVKIYKCETVEEFWGLVDNIRKPSEIENWNQLFLFKDGILPEWEDIENKDGGSWQIQVKKPNPKSRNRNWSERIDNAWKNISLSLIGEQFPNSELVCGAAVTIRPAFCRISLWTKFSDEENQMKIGRHFKTDLEGFSENITFCFHSDRPKQQRGNQPKYKI